MAELRMPWGGGGEPGWPDGGNGKQIVTRLVKRRPGVVVRPTPNIALPTASLVSLGLPV